MVRSFRMSIYRIMPFVKREFYFFLSNQDAFISLVLFLFCLSVLAWSFNELFDRNIKCEYYRVLDLERKKHFFSTFSVCLLCILYRSLHTCWRSTKSGLLSIAFIIYGYLSSAFSSFLTWLHYFYAFIYFLVVVGLFSVL